MEKSNESASMIHMFPYPVFCVKDGIISEANHYAKKHMVRVGTPIRDLLEDSLSDYNDFHGCSMSLTLHIGGAAILAVIIPFGDMQVFHLYSENANEGFRAMALVAQELSEPLTELFNLTQVSKNKRDDLCLRKSFYKLQRISSNISAANAYTHGRPYGMEIRDVAAILREILAEAEELAGLSGQKLVYTCPGEVIYCPVDTEILKKAVFNLISNAIKGSPPNSTIRATVTHSGDRIRFSIQNTDTGLGAGDDLFSRHLRAPQIDDGRHGIGLGIPIAQLAASTHNGTLLMDRPEADSIRFTMTLSTRTRDGDILRSPMVQIDYLGGLRHSFVELADVLPTSAFKKI